MKVTTSKTKYEIKHVGIIPDGGRRWSEDNNCELLISYNYSFGKLISILESFEALNIKEVTIYLSSKSNFRRSNSEVIAFCKSETEFISKLSEVNKFNIKIIGDTSIVPLFMKEKISKIKKNTKSNSNFSINLLIGFDPFEYYYECTEKANSVNEFITNLQTKMPLDIIFRSGGCPLLSGFLPLESSNATLITLEKLFNDIPIETYSKIIQSENKKIKKYGV